MVRNLPIKTLLPRLMTFVPLLTMTSLLGLIAFIIADHFITVRSFYIGISLIFLLAATAALIWVMGLRDLFKMRELGLIDALSGLGNRRAFHHVLDQAMKGDKEVALALIDLDGFKQVNDFHGHAVGDELIMHVSRRLQTICADDATPFRLGGDEFALCMVGSLAGTLLEGMSRRFIQDLGQPVTLGERRVVVGASIGLCATKDGQIEHASELLRRADSAMYEAKRAGKMRCVWHRAAFDQDLEQRRQLDIALQRAVERKEFSVVYQPIVDIRTAEICGLEALLRWHKDGGDAVDSDIFLPAAEASGLIHEIGSFALEQACHGAARWDNLDVSVNISTAQLRNPDFPRDLGEILERSGIDPNRLTLDIAETSFIADPVAVSHVLAIIRGFGVNVALDDFGTGYASIGFLRRFEFEKLKLDQSLVVAACKDNRARTMLVPIISMAHALGMSVIAEGVETHDQAALMRMAGCDLAQGWHFYYPMPIEGVEELFKTKNHIAVSG